MCDFNWISKITTGEWISGLGTIASVIAATPVIKNTRDYVFGYKVNKVSISKTGWGFSCEADTQKLLRSVTEYHIQAIDVTIKRNQCIIVFENLPSRKERQDALVESFEIRSNKLYIPISNIQEIVK